MRYLTRRPPSPLSDFVADIWLYSDYRPRHRFERIMPTGTIELVISLREDKPLRCYHPETCEVRGTVYGPLLSGARAGHSLVDTEQQTEIMGVHFRPGGAGAFLDLPADEVQARDIPLELLWGTAARELHERLLAAASPERRLALVEEVLLGRLRPERRLHPVMRGALRELDQVDAPVEIGRLAGRAGWSDRHFIRTFSAQVGITPKAYGRIRRFQAALTRIRAGRRNDWAALAADCGYYDQAHFIRDFRAFSGLTPAAYARLETGDLNHVPVAERPQICPVVDGPASKASLAAA